MAEPRDLHSRVTGYVLAGGRSTRMGADKSLLELAGVPLVERAVNKLQVLPCTARILSARTELERYAPLVPDLRCGCGPLGGIEAALSDAATDWALLLPVDVPFIPSALLRWRVAAVLDDPMARVAFFSVDGAPQPALCMVHRELLPLVSKAIDESRLKLLAAFECAADEFATPRGVKVDEVLKVFDLNEISLKDVFALIGSTSEYGQISPRQKAATKLWFANLNTPEEFARACEAVDALESS